MYCLNKCDRWRYSFAIIRCPLYSKPVRQYVISKNNFTDTSVCHVADEFMNKTAQLAQCYGSRLCCLRLPIQALLVPMLSRKLNVLEIPLNKELIANYLLETHKKTLGADPGCDGINVGWYGTAPLLICGGLSMVFIKLSWYVLMGNWVLSDRVISIHWNRN